jgi:hypothetical protein
MLQEEIDRRDAGLTSEERSRLNLSYRQLLEQGLCRPRLSSSLLGFAWSQFEPRVFPDHAGDPSFRNTPEFLSLGLVTLDAYVTAMLAAPIKHGDYEEMVFRCELKKESSSQPLQLEFVTVTELRRMKPKTAMVELLSSLPQILQMKEIRGDVCYMSDEGCRMMIPYPGKMKAERCPSLRDRPYGLWPAVNVKIRPTRELVARARGLVDSAWDWISSRGRPN